MKATVWFFVSKVLMPLCNSIVKGYIKEKYELVVFSKDSFDTDLFGLKVHHWSESSQSANPPSFAFFATETDDLFYEHMMNCWGNEKTTYGKIDEAAEILLDSYGKMGYIKAKVDFRCPRELGPHIEMGDFSYYGELNVLSEIRDGSVKLRVGKFCSFAPKVNFLLAEEHSIGFSSTYPFSSFFKYQKGKQDRVLSKGDIIVGNDVWIGYQATILSGVSIGDGCVIGSGSIVAKSVEPYSIVVGNPGRVIKKRFNDETIKRFEEMRWWDWNYEELFEALPLIQSEDTEALWETYCERVKGRV